MYTYVPKGFLLESYMIDANNKFTQMQQNFYDKVASTWDASTPPISDFVGVWDELNNWEDSEALFVDIPDIQDKDVLDFGCGPGRNLVKYNTRCKSMAGVDISTHNLEKAKEFLEVSGCNPNKFTFYKNDGVNLDTIESNSFDVIMSIITWQHISVYDIRYNLLKEFYRVLRPGGYITIETVFTTNRPGTVGYYENFYDAPGTNSSFDCVVENPEYVKKDVESIGFRNFKYHIFDYGEESHIYFNAQK